MVAVYLLIIQFGGIWSLLFSRFISIGEQSCPVGIIFGRGIIAEADGFGSIGRAPLEGRGGGYARPRVFGVGEGIGEGRIIRLFDRGCRVDGKALELGGQVVVLGAEDLGGFL